MISELRTSFNARFSEEKYRTLLERIDNTHPGQLDFRVAETPVFIDKQFKNEMLDTCEFIIDTILSPDFKKMTAASIPQKDFFAGAEGLPSCMVFDFGVCRTEAGFIQPQLIEMQGFPSLSAYQILLSDLMKEYAEVPETFDSYLNGYTEERHIKLLKEIIIGSLPPEEVILLDIFPEKQKTRIDFKCTEKMLGITTVCLTRLMAEGNCLFYYNGERKIRIRRIFNRLIMDDLNAQQEHIDTIDIRKAWDVEWVVHPHWFYRISKYTLPFLQHRNIPDSYFLNELKQALPLNEYVLKPLFSFAGKGVITDIKPEDIDNIPDPENWMLQKKVHYAPVIITPEENAITEIRLFYFMKSGWTRPRAVHNLTRLSKGAMIGTQYNRDKTWVGGSIAFFEK